MSLCDMDMKKKPSGTACLIVVTLLVFVMLSLCIIYTEIQGLMKPLNTNKHTLGEVVVDSEYIKMDIIEQGNTFIIMRDIETDVLYMELKRNGYSSALTVICNADGTPKTYSQFVNGG